MVDLSPCQHSDHGSEFIVLMARSSSRLGHSPLKAGARVRVPYALPVYFLSLLDGFGYFSYR